MSRRSQSQAVRVMIAGRAQTLMIAAELKIHAYDAYVLQCARLHHSPVLTLDGGLARAAKEIGLDALEVSE